MGGPKKAVKQYVSGMNKLNASKIIDSMDIVGTMAWGYYDVDDFTDDDYDEFLEEYEEYEDEYGEEIRELLEDREDDMDEMFEEYEDEYKSFKTKIEKFKGVEKLGKDLYAVEVKISMEVKPKDKDEEEMEESITTTFVVYKDKVISAGDILF